MLVLAAIGLAITFGVMGVINMAHGEMMMLGAYIDLRRAAGHPRTPAAGLYRAYLFVAVPAAFLVAGLVGIAIERSLIRFLYGRPLETLLATWGCQPGLAAGRALDFRRHQPRCRRRPPG